MGANGRGQASLLALSIAFVGVLAGPGRAGPGYFADAAGHWAEPHIARAVAAGLVSGHPDGTFRPDATITRAAFLKLAVQAGGWPLQRPGTPAFSDVAGHWVETQGYLQTAQQAGLIWPAEYNYVFAPEQPITREEMAVLAARVLGESGQPTAAAAAAFTDAEQMASGYRPLVMQAVARGIFTGFPDGSFRPRETATRAQAVVIALRLVDQRRPAAPPPGAGKSGDDPDAAAGLMLPIDTAQVARTGPAAVQPFASPGTGTEASRRLGGLEFHLVAGATVRAAAAGRVTAVTAKGGPEAEVFIDTSQGYYLAYNHVARVAVAVGDQVQQGQVVGLAGKDVTGGSWLQWDVRRPRAVGYVAVCPVPLLAPAEQQRLAELIANPCLAAEVDSAAAFVGNLPSQGPAGADAAAGGAAPDKQGPGRNVPVNTNPGEELVATLKLVPFAVFPVDLGRLFWDDEPGVRHDTTPMQPFSNHRNVSHIEGAGKWYIENGRRAPIVLPVDAVMLAGNNRMLTDPGYRYDRFPNTYDGVPVYVETGGYYRLSPDLTLKLGHVATPRWILDRLFQEGYLSLPAGTVIAYTQSRTDPGAQTSIWDFQLIDRRVRNGVSANPTSELENYACPLGYFTPELQTEIKRRYQTLYQQMVRNGDQPESDICSPLNINIPGTVWGNWYYKSGFPGNPEPSHSFRRSILAFLHSSKWNPETFTRKLRNGATPLGIYAEQEPGTGQVTANAPPVTAYGENYLARVSGDDQAGVLRMESVRTGRETCLKYQVRPGATEFAAELVVKYFDTAAAAAADPLTADVVIYGRQFWY